MKDQIGVLYPKIYAQKSTKSYLNTLQISNIFFDQVFNTKNSIIHNQIFTKLAYQPFLMLILDQPLITTPPTNPNPPQTPFNPSHWLAISHASLSIYHSAVVGSCSINYLWYLFQIIFDCFMILGNMFPWLFFYICKYLMNYYNYK